MSYFATLEKALSSRGWTVQQGDKNDLLTVKYGAPVMCVDGRPAKGSVSRDIFLGPKVQGGAAGVAALIAREERAPYVTIQHIKEANDRIVESGFKSGVHDMSDNHLHCGRVAKGRDGQLSDPDWQVSPDAIARAVTRQGGYNIPLAGEHEEKFVGINFMANTTRMPDSESPAFHLDAWYANVVRLDLMMLLIDAADTVEKISDVRQAVIWE